MCGHGTIAVGMAMVALGLVRRGENGARRSAFETTAASSPPRSPTKAQTCYGPASRTFRPMGGAGRRLRPAGGRRAQGRHRVGRQTISGSSTCAAPRCGSRRRTARSCRASGHGARAAAPEVAIQHPASAHIQQFNFVTFWHERRSRARSTRTSTSSRPASSTARRRHRTSAMMAMFEARGQLKLHQRSAPRASSAPAPSRAASSARRASTARAPSARRSERHGGLLGTARWTINRDDVVDAGFLVA